MKSLKDSYKLHNGVLIPCVGFGTYLSAEGDVAYNSVRTALDAGYRHIDTASVYGNENSVGRAVRESGIPREEIFVTTKVWNSDQGYKRTLKAFEQSMNNLGLDYLDLYLIHWPRIKGKEAQWAEYNRQTWLAMTELYRQGRIRSIGVSNFKPHHIESLMEVAEVLPMVNQIELHPGLLQEDTVGYCKEKGIVVESWGPMSRGKLLGTGVLDPIAEKYGKTPAQVCLRWHLQMGFLPLPKSVTPSRIEENANLFDFQLMPDDMAFISSISIETGTGMDPDKVAH
ncbi:MAG: aldo/keto reductase [Rikenellaceae bacterium]|nr:aldo/keto reductase [Rikenellaceae bacterium]